MAVPDIRVVNIGLDVSRTFLSTVQNVLNSVLTGSVGVIDNIEARLPDIPLVSRPGGVVAPVAMLPAARMRALPSPGAMGGAMVPRTSPANPWAAAQPVTDGGPVIRI